MLSGAGAEDAQVGTAATTASRVRSSTSAPLPAPGTTAHLSGRISNPAPAFAVSKLGTMCARCLTFLRNVCARSSEPALLRHLRMLERAIASRDQRRRDVARETCRDLGELADVATEAERPCVTQGPRFGPQRAELRSVGGGGVLEV